MKYINITISIHNQYITFASCTRVHHPVYGNGIVSWLLQGMLTAQYRGGVYSNVTGHTGASSLSSSLRPLCCLRSRRPPRFSPADGCAHGNACNLVFFQPGLAWKPRLWLGLRGLWLSHIMSRAKAVTHGLALAWLGLGRGLHVYRTKP